MNYNWENYSIEKHIDIDKWNKENYEIDKYAMYGDKLSNQVLWYKNNPKDVISNYKDVIFVIRERTVYIGYMICNISLINDYFVSNINPIVINPSLLRRGFAESVIKELIQYSSELLVEELKYIMVMVDETNVASINLFSKLGFLKHKVVDDFIEYRFYLKEEIF